MRIWVDLTNSPHVPVLAPLVRVLRARGDDVRVTARRFAQTVELAERFGLDAEVVGAHGGATRAGKARAAAGRVADLHAWARRVRPDVALAHGSTDQPMVARLLGIPATTMFDYEFAKLQHHLNCRLAVRTLVPDAIPPERLAGYGARGRRLARYPGLKEEYAMAALEPDPGIRAELGVPASAILAVLRPPPELALYHRLESPLFPQVLERLAADPDVVTVVLPRTAEQGARIRDLGHRRVLVPEHAIDGQSLVAAADLAVSAGGTMNREAVVLGTPVWTTFAGRIGAVDERLIAEGRLRRLTDPADVAVVPKPAGAAERRVRRDPALLVALALGEAVPGAAAPGRDTGP